MREQQRQGLAQDIAMVLGGPGPWLPAIEHRRTLWGATPAEAHEVVLRLDHLAAAQYQQEYLDAVPA